MSWIPSVLALHPLLVFCQVFLVVFKQFMEGVEFQSMVPAASHVIGVLLLYELCEAPTVLDSDGDDGDGAVVQGLACHG